MTFSSDLGLFVFGVAPESGLHPVQRISGPRVSGFYKNADIAVIRAGGFISGRESGRNCDQC